MRILLVHPNDHSGGAEIAGNWPPAWAAYLAGALKRAGYTDVRFIDAMTDHIPDETLAGLIREADPDIIGTTAITPSIYKAERVLEIAQQAAPRALRVLGGGHATFMYKQVLAEAPQVDVIVRGEGEEILIEIVRAVEAGAWETRRRTIKGVAFRDGGSLVATPAAPTIKDLDAIAPDWGILSWEHLPPARPPCGHPQHGARLPLPLLLQQPVDVLARLPHPRPQEGGGRDRDAGARPQGRLLHPRRRGTHHQPQEVRRLLRGTHRPRPAREGEVGHQHPRHRHPAGRGAAAALSPRRARARLARHRGGSADEARPLQQGDHHRAEQEAIRLLREADIFTEARFIVGLENETAETLEETYRMARDWNPDLANWAMYTPWPFSPLFQELRDKVETYDFETSNVVTPIIKPEAMDRAELLDRVMHNDRRFYMIKALFHSPWRGSGFRRKYLLGCLKAFLKAGFRRTFYDLGRVGYWRRQTRKTVDSGFDASRRIAPEQAAEWDAAADRTADYLLAHRIPRPAQWLLRALPARLAAPLLLRAVARNAWTFAGSGRVFVTPGPPAVIEIEANPLATAPCHFHLAVFTRLFRTLVHPQAEVHETLCCGSGAAACRFAISWSRR